jgi:ABC-type phosphate transport system substrate-binding protein
MRKIIASLTFAALALGTASANADIVVIVNPKNDATLNAEQVSALYLGTAVTFSDGAAVALVDQQESSGIRGEFYQKATGRSVAQVKATWARITFTGKGTPPKELKSDAEVKAFVASNPKAIGYINSSAVDSSIKVAVKF